MDLLWNNLTNPALLLFALGILFRILKSDFKIPDSSSKFIAIYLLFSIGFKGGQELAHSGMSPEIVRALLLGVFLSAAIPLYAFFLLKRFFNPANAGAIAAAYGSVSAVTFVAAQGFLEFQGLNPPGYAVAVMAAMEIPAIAVGILLIQKFDPKTGVSDTGEQASWIRHAMTNGSVLLLLGSLLAGLLSNPSSAAGIEPFTHDLFKGFLALFLLDMGLLTAQGLRRFLKSGGKAVFFAVLFPLINGCLTVVLSRWVTEDLAGRFLLCVLAASASYIAVPAALKMAAPKADPGIYVPMALGITFPFNLVLGMPLYFTLLTPTW